MNISRIVSIIVIITSIIVFDGCTENPIPYDLTDPELSLDTLTITSIDGGTYLSPPLMGNITGLYFGESEGFNNLFSLIQFSQLSLNSAVRTYNLLEESIIIDSVVVTFTGTVDSLLTDGNFELFYFPTSGDSIFGELVSNYLNIDETGLGTSVSLGQSSFTLEEPDSTESVYPKLSFKINDTDDIIKFIADTTDNQNRSFMIKNIDPINNFISIRSRESVDYPLLNIYYRTDTDTLHSVFFPTADITIVEPREITDTDMNNISVSRAAGLKSILQFDLSNLPIDSTVMVIKSAQLIVNADSDNPLDDFEIKAVVLEDSLGTIDEYWEITKDEYTIEDDLLMTGTFDDNQLIIGIRPFLQGVNTGSFSNYGLKLYSSLTSNPFQTAHIDLNTNPYLKIVYVKL